MLLIMKQRGFFDETDRLKELGKLGDPLEKPNRRIKWESFRGILTRTLKKTPDGPGGRPPFDCVMMFKITILQKLYNISDDQAEYQIKDRLSFQRFLGLALYDAVPDAQTVWRFREELTNARIIDTIFYRFVNRLEEEGIISYGGSIIDAAFADVPRQRNGKDENNTIKEGKVPGEWEEEKNKNKKSQKDADARWAIKNKETHFGYKDRVKTDKKSKITTRFSTTGAEVHDSQELKNPVEPAKDKRICADSACAGEEVQNRMPEDVRNRTHEKGHRNTPLTKTQNRNNKTKSHIRVRVEHAFGDMTNTMGGIFIRTIGKVRAHAQIALMNFAYNLRRATYITGVKNTSIGTTVSA